MKVRIKACDIEIEYEESSPENGYFFMSGKGGEYTDKLMDCVQKMIDGADKLLETSRKH